MSYTGKQRAVRGATFEDEFRRSCGILKAQEIKREPAGHDYTLVYKNFRVGVELKCRVYSTVHLWDLTRLQLISLGKCLPYAFVIVNWRVKQRNRAFIVPYPDLLERKTVDASMYAELPRIRLRSSYGWNLVALEEEILNAHIKSLFATSRKYTAGAANCYSG